MSAGIPWSFPNAQRQLRVPAPPVAMSVPSTSKRIPIGDVTASGFQLTVSIPLSITSQPDRVPQ